LDFVMSKVGLSVCALVSASVLGTVLADSELDERRQELREVLQRMCDLVSSAATAGGDSVRAFRVPSLSTGEPIKATITNDGTCMSSGPLSVIEHPCSQVHLWRWDGRDLNESVVTELDRSYGETTAVSGDLLDIFAMSMDMDGVYRVLVFILAAGPTREL
jgi:hypothetical protein